MHLEAAKTLLKSRLGLSFEGHGEDPLRLAIERRLTALGATGVTAALDYVARLAQDPDELATLTSLLTIKETYFFRESEHLRLLIEHLAPELLRTRRPDEPVRILCVGCATGEEPYSIRIALRERWGLQADRNFAIVGVDLDREALAAARRACYRPHALRILDTDQRARWFTATPQGDWRLAGSIRTSVEFLPLNLLASPYPDPLRGQDLIFYRNLSIYFDPPTRQLVMARLAELLQSEGYLIVGVAETLANDCGVLTLREHRGVWYFAKASDAPLPLPQANPPRQTHPSRNPPAATNRAWLRGAGLGSSSSHAPTTPTPSLKPPRIPPYQQALALTRAEHFGDALKTLAPLVSRPDAEPPHLALQAQILYAQGDLAGAEEAALKALDSDPWLLEPRVLLGRISRHQGRLDLAIEQLRHAIYQRPNFWPAHGELAECRQAAGQRDAARREYEITLRLLATGPEVLAQAGPLPLALPWLDLRQLYQARLARLGDQT